MFACGGLNTLVLNGDNEPGASAAGARFRSHRIKLRGCVSFITSKISSVAVENRKIMKLAADITTHMCSG